jgi:hypothetical protein
VLVVEDGSGVFNANAYADIAFVEGYLVGDRLQAFTTFTESEKEAAVITATRYIDGVYPWKGTRKSLEQGLAWPRVGVEFEGFPIEGVPAAVMRATAESVGLVMDNPEGLFSTDNERFVTSEKVDTISVTYSLAKDAGRAAVTKYQALDSLLKGLYVSGTSGSSVGSSRVVRV